MVEAEKARIRHAPRLPPTQKCGSGKCRLPFEGKGRRMLDQMDNQAELAAGRRCTRLHSEVAHLFAVVDPIQAELAEQHSQLEKVKRRRIPCGIRETCILSQVLAPPSGCSKIFI